ncbi:MAG: HU family DNA-binding protein [Duncaniella sp.]|nr:HU family DNA-binding protein [Duncaniella sp.]MDE6417735.1 HU family DNA-binding protein [Duncaniella sp.]
MDNKQFAAGLARQLGTEAGKVAELTAALADTIRETCAGLDSAAIPGFGTFQGVKTEEHITNDPATGKRVLMPPSITLHFAPSVVLRKKLKR